MAATSVTSVSVLGLSSSPSSQYSTEMPMGLSHTGMPSEVMQSQTMSAHHAAAWYSIPPTTSTYSPCGPGPVVNGSPFDEWPGPNSGSPISANTSCIGGSPANPLTPCGYGHAMNMVNASYGQSIQVGPYHSHPNVHRTEHYSDHLHSHHHFHPHVNPGLIQPGNIHGNATPVHPSPDSGLTASSDGGTESPNGQHNTNLWINSSSNGMIKQENVNNSCSVRPQPARSPYEWMKKPSYQNQVAPGKTRTKDKYRVVYSDHQRLELEKEFHYSRYITIKRKAELAMMLGLSERQVKIWFQNRRAKERKQNKKREEMNRKDSKDHLNHVINHTHTQQLHQLHGLIN